MTRWQAATGNRSAGYTRGMPVFGFERVCIGVEGKAGMRRSSRTTASISNAAIRAKARVMEAENRCAVGILCDESHRTGASLMGGWGGSNPYASKGSSMRRLVVTIIGLAAAIGYLVADGYQTCADRGKAGVIDEASPLPVGKSRSFHICAANPHNRSGILLVEHGRYRIDATAKDGWDDWYLGDLPINGHDPAWLAWGRKLRACPEQRWFELTGSLVGRRDICFPIDESVVIRAPASGELEVFANDIPFLYWNNSGDVTVRVTRME